MLFSEFTKLLQSRDLLYQTSEFDEDQEISGIYCGFDATAKSLQVGNLISLAVLKLAALHNINTIAILGGTTTSIGDPSGKNEARREIERSAIDSNLENIHHQIKKLLPNTKILNNYVWLNNMNLNFFLEEIAKHISVNSLIKLKIFADRLIANNHLSLKEMIYPLLQGYDFLYLFENEKCNVQCGGADQWCNILVGKNLIDKKNGQIDDESVKRRKVFAVTNNLLVDKNGNKLGKSIQGAIYIDQELCSVFDFWQFWRNIDDQLVESSLLRLTELDNDYIKSVVRSDINRAKILLANEITKWVHSNEEADLACNQAAKLFRDKNTENIVEVEVRSNKLIEICAELMKISNTKAKILIEQSGIKIDGIVIVNIWHQLESNCVLQIGKKIFFKVRLIV